MTPADIPAGIAAVVVIGCLLGIVVLFLLWAVASAVTVVRASRRARGRAEFLTGLARGATVSDLGEIDDELERVLAAELGRRARVPHQRGS